MESFNFVSIVFQVVAGQVYSVAEFALAFANTSPGKPPVKALHELEIRSALRQKAGRGELA